MNHDHLARLWRQADDLSPANAVAGDVDALAIYHDAVVAHDLPRFVARGAETHAEANRVQARFEQLQQALAGDAFLARCHRVDAAKLALEDAVDAADFLFLAQLLAVIREALAALLAVLAWRIGAALDGAFVGKTFLAFEEQFLALATALAAFWV